MTTARVIYRNYVPYGWIALEFCDVDFSGSNSESLDSMWRKIKYKRYDEAKIKIKRLQDDIVKYKEKVNMIDQELLRTKKWWRFWHTSSEKVLLKQREVLIENIRGAIKNQDSLDENKFYGASELVYKAKKFLKENGFVLSHTSSSGTECITHTDLWTKE